jgi:uncharacterized protein (DUF488 family)
MTFYTLGYQGIDIASYVRTLKNAGVGVVIDVRETAWSYKRGFCKSALSAELLRAGIDYVHLRTAGNPKENRRTAPTMQACLKRYQKYLDKNPAGVTDLIAQLEVARKRKRSVCLMCFERLPHECHRSILAASVQRRTPSAKAVHLQAQ